MHEDGSVVQDFRVNMSMIGYDLGGSCADDLFTRQLRGNSDQPQVKRRFRAALPLLLAAQLRHCRLSTCCRMGDPCGKIDFTTDLLVVGVSSRACYLFRVASALGE